MELFAWFLPESSRKIKEQEVLRAERDSLKKTVDKAATGMHSLGCSSANNSVGGGRGNGFVCSVVADYKF